MKIHFGFFHQSFSHPVSLLASRAAHLGCELHLHAYGPKITDDEIHGILERSTPDLAALSFVLYSRNLAFRVARIAKSLGIKVLAGGVHPSSVPQDVMSSGYFDAVVVGDGLGVIEEIIQDYPLWKSEIIQGRPAREDGRYFDYYFTPEQRKNLKKSKIYEIFTSVGCPVGCTFCAASTTLGFRRFDIDAVVDTLKNTERAFSTREVFIWDDTFTLELNRVRNLRKKLEQQGLSFRFSIQARTGSFNKSMASELKKLGCYQAAFGVETASNSLLKFLGKKATAADAYNAAALCAAYDIEFEVFLMLGLPTQTKKDYEKTVEFVEKTRPAKVYVSYFVPYPRTSLFEYCLKHGYMPNNWSFDHYLGSDDPETGLKRFSGLKNIDYRMAMHYHGLIEQAAGKEEARGPKRIRITGLSASESVSRDQIQHAVQSLCA